MQFILKVVLSFAVGGVYVSTIVWIAEKLGSRIGGIIAGTPSTLLVSTAFINLAEGPDATKKATAIIPVLILASLLYVCVFTKITTTGESKYRNIYAVFLAFSSWLGVSLFIRSIFSGSNIGLVIAVSAAGIIGFHYVFRHFENAEPKIMQLPRYIYFVRFLVAGAVVALSVIASRVLGPTWGAIAGSFPATFATVIYFLSKSQGRKFTQGFIRGLPVAFLSTMIYVVVLHVLLTSLPTLMCFVLAISVSLIYSLLITYGDRSNYFSKRRSQGSTTSKSSI